jgi:hypothetical protein
MQTVCMTSQYWKDFWKMISSNVSRLDSNTEIHAQSKYLESDHTHYTLSRNNNPDVNRGVENSPLAT